MAGKLKIYACSGIGDAPKGRVQMYDYWTDNTNTLNNTQAVNGLLADINLLMAEIDYIPTLSDRDVIDRLNQIDLLVVCLDAAQNYAQHYTKLEKARSVIGTMLAKGQFKSNSLDNQSRDEHLDKLLAYFNDAMAADGQYVLASAKFTNWFNQNVIMKNQVGLSVKERTAMQSALSQAVSGIGYLDYKSDPELSKYLCDAGTYFLYTYFTSAQLKKIPAKNRKTFEDKRDYQRRIYNYCKGRFLDIYGDENKMQSIIRTGIVAQFGAQPESVCERISIGDKSISGIEPISWTIEAIVTLIVGIVSAIAGIITAVVVACINRDTEKYKSINEDITKGIMAESDFEGLDTSSQNGGIFKKTTAGSSSMLPMLIIGAAAIFAFLKK